MYLQESLPSKVIHEIKERAHLTQPRALCDSQGSEAVAAIEPLWTGAKSRQVFSPSLQQQAQEQAQQSWAPLLQPQVHIK